ncbi:MAG: M23 family metallopeptidase [Deltaproteobacteria bacterium]|nr:M23 family metallopeptidase [Deltaproteobacteria bacterium]MCX7953262.1 M23 family metallopeptidase [Deltaproteobacteria bacterium]
MEKILQWSLVPFIFFVFSSKFIEFRTFEFWNGAEKRRLVLSKHNRRNAPKQVPLIIDKNTSALELAKDFGLIPTSLNENKFLRNTMVSKGQRIFVEKRRGEVIGFKFFLNKTIIDIVKQDKGILVAKQDPIVISRVRDVSGLIASDLSSSLRSLGLSEEFVKKVTKVAKLPSNAKPYAFSIRVYEEIYGDGDIKSQIPVGVYVNTDRGEVFKAALEKSGTKYFDLRDIAASKHDWLYRPVNGKITSHFSKSRFHPILGFKRPHPSIDISAPYGTPVRAVGPGVVIFSGWYGSSGNMIKIRHGHGVETVYRHLSKLLVTRGQKVTAGTIVGKVGATGLATGPHLCFSVVVSGKFVDPLRFKPFWSAPVDTRTRNELNKIYVELKSSSSRIQLAQKRLSTQKAS